MPLTDPSDQSEHAKVAPAVRSRRKRTEAGSEIPEVAAAEESRRGTAPGSGSPNLGWDPPTYVPPPRQQIRLPVYLAAGRVARSALAGAGGGYVAGTQHTVYSGLLGSAATNKTAQVSVADSLAMI